ncbi:MAG: hypothetical protein ABJB85_10895 [Nitrososphaerota archaeon]
MPDNQQSPFNIISDSDYKAYYFKIIRELCERHKKAVKEGNTTDFKINEIWIEHFQQMFDFGYFLRLLNRIRDEIGYIELQDNIIRLGESRKNLCAEVDISLD